MRALRIASYNIRAFHDDTAAAARVVRAIDPDVLCLQEVSRRLFSSQRIAAFAQECGLVWAGHHRGSGGTTILTSLRVDVRQSGHYALRVQLARAIKEGGRGYAVVAVALPGHVPVTVASLHLGLLPDERVDHTRTVLDAIGAGSRTVVCGDLNEQEGGGAWRLLATPMRLVSPTAPTFSSTNPRKVIDVVFATPDLEALPHAPAAIDEDDIRAGSDHRPVWADLDVPATT